LTRSLSDRLAIAVGTGLGSGFFPVFPGTAGSVAGLVLYLLLLWSGALASVAGWLITLVAVFAIGVPSAHRCEAIYGTDNKRIVVDEIWGMLISLCLVPATWKWVLPAFILFRFFDVVKPFPGRRAERVGGGLGIMLDDGVAGIYTVVILHAARAILGAIPG
jgi:phosphatidylglycerophosphatase A